MGSIYREPAMLEILAGMERERGPGYLNVLGFCAADRSFRYDVTPADAITCLATGSNGLHFAFLTDFGFAESLEQAPIISVATSDDPPIRLVAKNLRDLLRLLVTVGEAENLTLDLEELRDLNYDEYSLWRPQKVNHKGDRLSSEEYESAVVRFNRFIEERDALREVLRKELGIEPMEDVPGYLEQLRAERAAAVVIETFDKVGILRGSLCEEFEPFDYGTKDTGAITAYLAEGSLCRRLAFYRNASFAYIFADDHDAPIRDLTASSLRSDGFLHEAEAIAAAQ